MKYALLAGAALQGPEQPFDPRPSVAAMEALLARLDGWSIVRAEGSDASREGLLAALAELESRVEPNDAALFYFVGHGGVVRIQDLQPPLGRRPVFYLATTRANRDWRFEGVLDIELSLVLSRINKICNNVSAILDSCYSAQVVRGPIWPLPESPPWLQAAARALAASDPAATLHPRSHPDIIRLAASSSLRRGYCEPTSEGHLGRLTRFFTGAVNSAGEHHDRLSWDALVHRVRERAIWELGCEEQWVSLSGPRQRLLFRRAEAEIPRSVGFVPSEQGTGGWIRAGTLQGVEPGDEWTLAELPLDETLRPKTLTRMRVSSVDLNRAALTPVPGEPSTAPIGASAHLRRAKRRFPLRVDDPELANAVERSPWLERAEPASATVSVNSGRLALAASEPGFAPLDFTANTQGRAAALEQLEDWARTRRLLMVTRSRGGQGPALRLGLRYTPSEGGRLRRLAPGQGPLHPGDLLRVNVHVDSLEGTRFISVIVIDVAGRPALLDDAEPEGFEVLPGEARDLGFNPQLGRGGYELRWPPQVPSDPPRKVTLIGLASRRPIMLGHLVRLGYGADLPRDIPRRTRAPRRAIRDTPRPRLGPEIARDWSASIVHLELAASKRSRV